MEIRSYLTTTMHNYIQWNLNLRPFPSYAHYRKYMYILYHKLSFFLSLVATFISRGSFFVCMSGLTLAIEFNFVLSRLCCCLYWIFSYGNGVDFWNTLWPIIYKYMWWFFKRWHRIRKKNWQQCEQYQYPFYYLGFYNN